MQIEAIAASAQGRVGVAAAVLETGEAVEFNGDQRFPMQSVYKLPIGMVILRQVDEKKLRLVQRIRVRREDLVGANQHSPMRDKYPLGVTLPLRELLRYSVSESDNLASDRLLRLAGGPKVVTRYLAALGTSDIVVANTEVELGRDPSAQYRNYATPRAMVSLLRTLHGAQGLSSANRAVLLRTMTQTPHGQRRLKGLLPPGTVVAHKTGTSGTVKGVAAATNDVGLITLPNGRHLAIAVFVSDSKADEATRERVIARVARAAWDRWGKRTEKRG